LTTAPSHAEAVAYANRFQSALYHKRLVEQSQTVSTATVVAQLQAAGCWVFGLTSRYANVAAQTYSTLVELGITMDAHAPFAPLHGQSQLFDKQSGALYSQGIVYTSAQPKGPILQRFLECWVFKDEIMQRSGHADDVRPSAAPAIVFADDRLSNVDNVARSLATVCKRRHIPYYAYHFTSNVHDGGVSEDAPQSTKNDILRVQIRDFIYRDVVHNDLEARKIVTSEQAQVQAPDVQPAMQPSALAPIATRS